MRQNPHVRICGGPGSATTLVYPTLRLLADHVIAPHYPDAADAPSRFAFSLRFQDRGRLTTAKP